MTANEDRDTASKSYLRLWCHRRRVHHLDYWTAALYVVALGLILRWWP